MKQSEIFLNSEGDGYFRRNQLSLADRERRAETDPLMRCVTTLSLHPRRILEIGCSNGWRLDRMKREFGADCSGIDPSAEAVLHGSARYPAIALTTGTAELLPYPCDAFDLVIFGFCLYLCDRQDLFRIAAESDRVLADGGCLMILDFHPPIPYRNPYSHLDGLYSYKMDYSQMYLWNPAYTLVARHVFAEHGADRTHADERLSVSALRKDLANAYPENPFERRAAP